MRETFRASVPKYAQDSGFIEDAIGARPLRGIYAVSDGASESFDSATWARLLVRRFVDAPLLVRRFVDAPDVNHGWLHKTVACYNRQFDRETMSWSAQAAFDRGSFATLTGVVLRSGGTLATILGVGDSIALLADGHTLVKSFPYDRPEQFKQRPILLSTVSERNRRVFTRPTSSYARHWSLRNLSFPVILLMTDALAAWVLREPGTRIQALLGVRTQTRFAALVEHERRFRRMVRDDTTLLVIR